MSSLTGTNGRTARTNTARCEHTASRSLCTLLFSPFVVCGSLFVPPALQARRNVLPAASLGSERSAEAQTTASSERPRAPAAAEIRTPAPSVGDRHARLQPAATKSNKATTPSEEQQMYMSGNEEKTVHAALLISSLLFSSLFSSLLCFFL
jgi:hypothetical protein